ncbi:DNA ligase [Synechococcus phage B3]|nr:DNA ligase [Synechococcus phage B3]QGT54756.1 DNA ligase [Synechococcus phage B23]
MPKIKKPLLAEKFNPNKAKFPYIATPKIDGIRFLMVDGVALSRKFKPIRNIHIQNLLVNHLPNGIDGELTSGDTFQSSTSAIMRIEGTPDFKVWIFDYVNPDEDDILPFYLRMLNMPALDLPFNHQVLSGNNIKSIEEIDEYEKICLNEGYEGVMLRDPFGTYKFGRSTVNDNILLKVKRFLDDEARVVAVIELMSNQNIAEKDNFGRTKRSSCIEGMIPMGTCGSLLLERSDGVQFYCGIGMDDKMRKEIWENKESYINQLAKYKFFPHGVKDLPRHPVLLGFRHPDDT